MAKALKLKYGNEVTASVEFISHKQMVLFDECMKFNHTRNLNVAPFTDVNDLHLLWLENEFLQ